MTRLAACGSVSVRVINYLSNTDYFLLPVLMTCVFILNVFLCIFLKFPTVGIGSRAETFLVLLFIVSSIPGLVRNTQ